MSEPLAKLLANGSGVRFKPGKNENAALAIALGEIDALEALLTGLISRPAKALQDTVAQELVREQLAEADEAVGALPASDAKSLLISYKSKLTMTYSDWLRS